MIEQKAPRRRTRATSSRASRSTRCRLPLALLTPQGQIVAANPAFAKFVMGVSVEVEGLPVQVDAARARVVDAPSRTSRARSRATRCAGSSRSTSPQSEVRRLLLWLDAVSKDHVVLGVQPLEL